MSMCLENSVTLSFKQFYCFLYSDDPKLFRNEAEKPKMKTCAKRTGPEGFLPVDTRRKINMSSAV